MQLVQLVDVCGVKRAGPECEAAGGQASPGNLYRGHDDTRTTIQGLFQDFMLASAEVANRNSASTRTWVMMNGQGVSLTSAQRARDPLRGPRLLVSGKTKI